MNAKAENQTVSKSMDSLAPSTCLDPQPWEGDTVEGRGTDMRLALPRSMGSTG